MNNLTTFYLVRHGETEWNVKRIIQGHTDSPLTKKGLRQTKKLVKKLENVKFDKIISSDLLRAKKTADILALDKRLSVEATEALREQPYGKYEGKPLQLLLDDLKEWEKLSEKAKFSYKVSPDVESDEESAIRFIRFLRDAAIAYPGKTLLIVSHGIIIKTVLVHLGYTKYEDDLFLDNSGFVIIEYDGVDFFVKEVNGVEKKRYG